MPSRYDGLKALSPAVLDAAIRTDDRRSGHIKGGKGQDLAGHRGKREGEEQAFPRNLF